MAFSPSWSLKRRSASSCPHIAGRYKDTRRMAAVAGLLLSEECVEIVINNKDFLNEVCLKQLIAKLLSYGILAGSIGFKLPQVLSCSLLSSSVLSPLLLKASPSLTLSLCPFLSVSLRLFQLSLQRKWMALVSSPSIVRSSTAPFLLFGSSSALSSRWS
jgi:hypothetical protein